MGIDDYIMPSAGRIEDGYINQEFHRFIGSSIVPGGADQLTPEPSFYAIQLPQFYNPHPGDPEMLGPVYQPYQAEMPPPVRGEFVVPPAPAPFEPDSSVVDYDTCRMTQSLFDWSMRNVLDQTAADAT